MIGDFNSRPANENAGPCLRFHLSFLRFRLFGRPPSMPLEPIPEPFGSRWSLSGHIRYIRLGTRATVTLESATRSNLLVQEFSGSWRTPQGTIPRARLEALDGPRSTERGPDRASLPLRPFYASSLRCQSRSRCFLSSATRERC